MSDLPVTPFPEDLVYSDIVDNNIPNTEVDALQKIVSPSTTATTTSATDISNSDTSCSSPWLTSAGREIRASFLFQSSCYLPDYDGTESEASGSLHRHSITTRKPVAASTNITPNEIIRPFHNRHSSHNYKKNRNNSTSSSSSNTAIMQSTSSYGMEYITQSTTNIVTPTISAGSDDAIEEKKVQQQHRKVMFCEDLIEVPLAEQKAFANDDEDEKKSSNELGYRINLPLHQGFHSLPIVPVRNSSSYEYELQQKYGAESTYKVGDEEETTNGLQSKAGVSTLSYNESMHVRKIRRQQFCCYFILIFMAVCFTSIAISCGIRGCGRDTSSSTSALPKKNQFAPTLTPFTQAAPTVKTAQSSNTIQPTVAPTPNVVISSTEELYDAVDSYISGKWYTMDKIKTPIGRWDVSQITNFSFVFNMFRNPDVIQFNDDISQWDTSNAITMEGMFYGAEKFNGTLSTWKTHNVENMKEMFAKTSKFGGNISMWDVSKVRTMEGMFRGANNFQGNLKQWNTSSVRNMAYMFLNCNSFTGNGIETWDTSNVVDMSMMFRFTPYFNGQISSWDVGRVTTMRGMFRQAVAFTGDLSRWNLRSVTDISQMFMHAVRFNADISGWNTSSLTTTSEAFFGAISFNGDISKWDVSNVVDLTSMFAGAVGFDQDLCPWTKVLPRPQKTIATTRSMFIATSCPEPVLPGSVDLFGFSFCHVCNSSIVVDGPNITTIEPERNVFDREGYKPILNQQELHTAVDKYFEDSSNTSSVASMYGYPIRKWNVSLVSNFSRTFDAERNPLAATFTDDIDEWDTSSAVSMSRMFAGASWFNGNLSSWSTDHVTTMESMFQNAFSFNGDLSRWSTSNCTTMASMFEGADRFDGNLSSFDTSKVIDMSCMFCSALSFKGIGLSDWNTSAVTSMKSMFEQTFSITSIDLSSWDVSNVVDMSAIFQHSSFDGDISDWNVEKVETFHSAFGSAGSFNHDISQWNVSSAATFTFMFAGAKGFNQDLCPWRPLLERSDIIRVSGMFASSACPFPADPILEGSEPIEAMCRDCLT